VTRGSFSRGEWLVWEMFCVHALAACHAVPDSRRGRRQIANARSSSDSEQELAHMTKALLGICAQLDDRISSLRKKEDVDQDADLARRLQAELEQEDARRQVGGS